MPLRPSGAALASVIGAARTGAAARSGPASPRPSAKAGVAAKSESAASQAHAMFLRIVISLASGRPVASRAIR
jgi:hypothetical protein